MRILVFALVATVALAQLPQEFVKRQVSNPYQETNECAYLSVGNMLPYSLWTCTAPYVQPYCGMTSEVKYDCCPGYVRSDMVSNKCAESEAVWQLMGDHLNHFGGSKLNSIVRDQAKFGDIYDNSSTTIYTVFLPYNDEAIAGANFDLSRPTSLTPHPVMASFVLKRLYSTDMRNGMKLRSMYKDQDLKVTIYSNSLMFIECRNLILPDHEAKNGLMHYVDGPMLPHVTDSFDRSTLFSALKSINSISSFRNDIPQDMVTLLSDTNAKWMTVFAPSNSGWDKIKGMYTAEERQQIVRNHILRKMICSGAITRRSTSLGLTEAGERIGVDCPSANNRVLVDACGGNSKITEADYVAGNGVVHVIENALVPMSVQKYSEAMKCMSTIPEVSKMYKMLEGCTNMNMESNKKYIWLLPTDEAYKNLENSKEFKEEFKKFTEDEQFRCSVFQYHMLKLSDDSITEPSWWNQNAFETNYVTPSGKKTYVHNYYVKTRDQSELYFNNARVKNLKAQKFSQGFIYYTNEVVMLPIDKTVKEYLASEPRLSATSGHFVRSKISDIYENTDSKLLFLAPTNDGWSTRPENDYSDDAMYNYLRLHLISLNLWHPGKFKSAKGMVEYFGRETYNDLNSHLMNPDGSANVQLNLKEEIGAEVSIGYPAMNFDDWALVMESNINCVDGMVWIIDWPLKCPAGYCDKNQDPPASAGKYVINVSACRTAVATEDEFNTNSATLAKNNEACFTKATEQISAYDDILPPE